ncbi:glycosyltransferase family protein [Ceratobasidium sp. AG-Ba]|nr:glycosyltransferase family protein [Ceratobasidium sp. AG-Ba]
MEPPRRTLPSLYQIKTAIKDFQRSPGSASIFGLQDIMALVYLPEHFDILKGSIIQACLVVLQQSANRGNIVDDELSVLALQILCFSISTAVLVRSNWLKGFLRSLESQRDRGMLPDEQIDVSMQLVSWLSINMGDIMSRGTQDLNHGLAAPHTLFGFEDGEPRPDTPVCLPEIGGFDRYHAQFLIKHLWRDRKYLMKTFQDVFLPGMSVLIHILWKHLEFMDETPEPVLAMQLCEIVIRYSLVCVSYEDAVMQRHYRELRNYAKDPKRSRVIDRDDLAMVVSCFVLKLAPPPLFPGAPTQIPLHYALELMEVMVNDVNEAKEYALCQPLQIAGFTRVWFDLEKIPRDANIKWTDIIPFTFIMLKITEYFDSYYLLILMTLTSDIPGSIFIKQNNLDERTSILALL